MRVRTGFSSGLLLTFALGCQRLDDGEPLQPTSLGEDGTGDGGGTFDPIETGGDDSTGGSAVPTNMCDPALQTGCAAGEKCTAITSSTGPVFTCVGAGGSELQPFDPCQASPETGLDACPAGTACIGTTSSGLCLPLCSSNSDCDGAVCSADPVNELPFCADDCSPFESLCAAPLVCRRNDERFSCGFLREQDVGGEAAPCDTTSDAGCAAGFACITGTLVPGCSSPGCCASLCDLGGADPCDVPATCNVVIDAPAPGFEEIGACFVPA